MSFRINCTSDLAKRGRGKLAVGITFVRHPNSTFRPSISSSAQIDSILTHFCQVSTRSASLNAPEDPSISLASQTIEDFSVPAVKVTEYLDSGYLWDFWKAEHPEYGSIVSKLIHIPEYPCSNPEYDGYIPEDQIIEEALREEIFYLGPLADLQGDLVPRYYGLYQSHPKDDFLAIILEDVTAPLSREPIYRDVDWKERLYTAYQRLHLKGVCHRNIDRRHILFNHDDEIRLVSFRRSSKHSLKDPDDVCELMSEAMLVRIRIGLEMVEEARASPLPIIYCEQLDDPEGFIQSCIEAENAPDLDWMIEWNNFIKENLKILID